MKLVTNNLVKKLVATSGLAIGTLSNFAFAATDDQSLSNLASLQNIINENAGTILHIVAIVATIVGLMLVLFGIKHLHSHHTGSPQEKHLSKGIASLIFGACLVLFIPLSHMLVGTVDTSTSFDTGVSGVSFSQV